MDETVLRAMQRWPNVPAVFGWLQLDRRGNWLVKTVGGKFERIVNPAMIEFVNRNYVHDDNGRWYFQNGPQRVFVTLDYTPWIYQLDRTAAAFTTHTGLPAQALRGLFLDDFDRLLLETELGIGVVSDRDLPAVLEQLSPPTGTSIEATLLVVADGEEVPVRLFGRDVAIAPIRSQEVAERFHFNPRPTPAPGQPDC
ncbi:MAG: hypothetical protein A2W18_02695 [Candidatus Muproteobacteria bacterium RBG_16_60_9]|uniref:DUF2946 domain-containing protein n=1 Tax=Candidatus Muproteobacteria bacterium RBG_16_60_9 TaxID=1817755 RepID=A0A1F6VDB7_9PROT|nr:MAG: hypothetical protein A2W18_02695 [Candidatus Muproteobacteria bacterium RBG_16_60_9]